MTTSGIAGDLSCLQIHGLNFSSDEDEVVLKKVEKCYSDMGIEFNRNVIDKPYMNKKKNKVRQLLLNLTHGKQEQPFTKPDQETI